MLLATWRPICFLHPFYTQLTLKVHPAKNSWGALYNMHGVAQNNGGDARCCDVCIPPPPPLHASHTDTAHGQPETSKAGSKNEAAKTRTKHHTGCNQCGVLIAAAIAAAISNPITAHWGPLYNQWRIGDCKLPPDSF
jgi:hypothetical protein